MIVIERVLVLVFGATTGATLHEFKVGGGIKLIWNKEIPWQIDGQNYLWPMDWLMNVLDEVKSMATPGTAIASAMWGADVVHMYNGRIIDRVLHYRSIPSVFAEDLIRESGISRYEFSRLMGNVHPEFYQMVFSSRYWRQYVGCYDPVDVIPLADWITWGLSGQKGHDQVMLHNQGVGVATSKLVNNYFDNSHLSQFAPVWPKFSFGQLLEAGNGVYVVPCTHDSAFARTLLASTGLEWGLWTGSWYGICKIVNEQDRASEQTFRAGLVFEAMPKNAMSAISNIGMHGPHYKALKNVCGSMSYECATGMALLKLEQVVSEGRVFSPDLLAHKPDDFARLALEQGEGDHSLALATMVNTIASNCQSGISNAVAVLGISIPNTVAIVGGFAENRAILKALQLHKTNVVVPPFAGLATQAGAAAHALCLSGMASNTGEALKMFSEK